MKINMFLSIGVVAFGLATATLKAQTVTTVLDGQTNTVDVSGAPTTFFGSVGNYFTSANKNFTWTNNVMELAVGADYMSGVNFAQFTEGQYDAGRWDIEGKIRNANIAGTVDTIEGGVGYTFIQYYSVKAQASLLGGEDLDRNSGMIEPKFTLRDKPTPNTFFGAAISLPEWFNGTLNRTPCIGLETGCTY